MYFGKFEPLLFLGRILLGIIIIYALYKTFESPPLDPRKVLQKARKPIDIEIVRKTKTYNGIASIILLVFFILLFVSAYLREFVAAALSIFGMLSSLAFVGLVYLYFEGKIRVVRSILIVLLILGIGSSLAFTTQSLGLIGLGFILVLFFFGLALAVFGALKGFTKIPALMTFAQLQAAKRKKKKSNS